MTHRILTAATAAALLLAGPAGAASPTKTRREVIPYEFSVPCGGFENVVRGRETIDTTTFYDRSGQAARVVFHDSFRETDTNSVTGKVLGLSGDRRDALDLATGIRTVTGKSFLLTDAGRGIVIHDAGRVVFDAPAHVVFEAGIHEVLHGDIDALVCDALA